MQRALARLMSEISENTYCAGWLVDLEYKERQQTFVPLAQWQAMFAAHTKDRRA